MAEAIVRGVVNAGIDCEICVGEPIVERREVFASMGVNTTEYNSEAIKDVSLAFLCVKPQSLSEVAGQLQGKFSPDQTIVSILAGVDSTEIMSKFAHWNVVRVMPNISAAIRESMSVWFATEAVDHTNSELVQTILKALGKEMCVSNEDLLDAATAISGSGPAYVFLFIEAMQDAGIELGFKSSQARLLAVQTVLGSAEFARQSNAHIAELKNQVTSPGGTTAAALRALEEAGFRAATAKGIKEALKRASELGGKK